MALKREPRFLAPQRMFLIVLYVPSSPSHSLEMLFGTACHSLPGAAPYLRTWARAVPSAGSALASPPSRLPADAHSSFPPSASLSPPLSCLGWVAVLGASIC